MNFLEVRPRQGIIAALAVAAAALAGYLGRWDAWLGVWPETEQHVSASFILTAPVAAAVGAFFGAAARRNGIAARRGVAGRSAWLVHWRAVGEPAAWVTIGLLLGTVPSWIATAWFAVNGHPMLLLTLAHAGALAAVTALGYQVGGCLPWFLGAPVAASVIYVSLGFLSFNADTILVAVTPLDDRWSTFERPLTWVLAVQTLLWLSVLAAVVAHRAGQSAVRFCLFVGAAALTTPLLYVTPATRGEIPEATAQTCQSTRALTLCLPRAKEVVRAGVTPEYERAVTALKGLVADKVSVLDDEAAGRSRAIDEELAAVTKRLATSGAEVIPLSAAGDISAYTRINRNSLHSSLISYIVPANGLHPADAAATDTAADDLRRPAMPSDVLQRWYLTQMGVPVDETAGVGSLMLDETWVNYGDRLELVDCFSRLAPETRAAWFSRHRDDIREGMATWEDLEECSARSAT